MLFYNVTIDYLSDIALKRGVIEEQYNNALECVEKQISIAYKQTPSEVNIGPYNTVF